MPTRTLLSEETISRPWLGSYREGAMSVRTRCLWTRARRMEGERFCGGTIGSPYAARNGIESLGRHSPNVAWMTKMMCGRCQ